jgi:gliding-associated putative ABC transporter substrate-binding component GldG
MKFKFTTPKKFKKADFSLTVLLLIGILIVVNFLSYQWFYRLDLTQGKIYSISSVSKKAVSKLDDVVNVRAYFSSNLPSQFFAIRQEVADILDEYSTYSNGKIRVEFVEPGTDDETARELYMKGIPQLTFQVVQNDQMQAVKGYMGIAFNYGDKTEVIPTIKQDTSDLEYQITAAIKKVTAKEMPVIGYVTSNKTVDPATEIKSAYEALGGLYQINQIKLDEKDVPQEIKTLIITGPKEAFSDAQLKTINKFVMRGGSLLVMLDGVTVDRGLSAQKNATKLDSLLAKYGIQVNQDVIADERNAIATFSQGNLPFSVNYPYWLRITNDGFSRNNSAVSNLQNVVLPWASSITIDESKIKRDSVTNLIFSTNQAWEVKDTFNLAPVLLATNPSARATYDLAVAVNGDLNNAYPGAGEQQQAKGRIIVVGDSDFATDIFLGNNSDNLTLFLNLVDSLSLDEDLINIRSKNIVSRPLKEGLTDSTKAEIRYANIFGVTALVLIYGLARYYSRRRSRFVDDI